MTPSKPKHTTELMFAQKWGFSPRPFTLQTTLVPEAFLNRLRYVDIKQIDNYLVEFRLITLTPPYILIFNLYEHTNGNKVAVGSITAKIDNIENMDMTQLSGEIHSAGIMLFLFSIFLPLLIIMTMLFKDVACVLVCGWVGWFVLLYFGARHSSTQYGWVLEAFTIFLRKAESISIVE